MTHKVFDMQLRDVTHGNNTSTTAPPSLSKTVNDELYIKKSYQLSLSLKS
jgi:hypothetical protein